MPPESIDDDQSICVFVSAISKAYPCEKVTVQRWRSIGLKIQGDDATSVDVSLPENRVSLNASRGSSYSTVERSNGRNLASSSGSSLRTASPSDVPFGILFRNPGEIFGGAENEERRPATKGKVASTPSGVRTMRSPAKPLFPSATAFRAEGSSSNSERRRYVPGRARPTCSTVIPRASGAFLFRGSERESETAIATRRNGKTKSPIRGPSRSRRILPPRSPRRPRSQST